MVCQRGIPYLRIPYPYQSHNTKSFFFFFLFFVISIQRYTSWTLDWFEKIATDAKEIYPCIPTSLLRWWRHNFSRHPEWNSYPLEFFCSFWGCSQAILGFIPDLDQKINKCLFILAHPFNTVILWRFCATLCLADLSKYFLMQSWNVRRQCKRGQNRLSKKRKRKVRFRFAMGELLLL